MALDRLRLALLDEMKLPDFKGRHLFIAKLRLIIFLLCWLMFVIFFPRIWKEIPAVPLIFNLGFFVTSLCYWFIVKEKLIITMSVFEVLADIISQSTIIYILGADQVVVFLFYGLYVIAAGSFFGYITALVAATFVLVAYCGLLILLQIGIVPEYSYALNSLSFFKLENFGYVFNLVFLPVALVVIVYGSKIAHYFSKIKERALETRNVQLVALNRIGSTIRKAMNLESVIDQVLKGVIQGLGFDVCFLALLSRKGDKVHFYVPKGNPYTKKMENLLGFSLADVHLPLEATENSAYQSILRNRVIIRNDMTELTTGLVPEIKREAAINMQRVIGFNKFVIAPLVAERKVVGALIGASKKKYVEESMVDTLDNFANQAALAIESAQLIEELQQKNIQLEEANKIKSDFLAIMSHELRTPLTAIIGYSEILLDKVMGELNKEQNDSLSEVLKNAETLLRLINSILDLAKVEAGKMEVSYESIAVEQLVQEVFQTLAPLVSRKEQSLNVDIPADLPSLNADSGKIRQILLNLVGNAIKFTPQKGRITVKVEYFTNFAPLVEPYRLEAKMLEVKGFFQFSVIDNGIGIREEHLSTIFDVFQQVDSTFTRKYQGTGLGLALSKEFSELHGGAMAVKSEFGKGSTFSFIIPENLPSKI